MDVLADRRMHVCRKNQCSTFFNSLNHGNFLYDMEILDPAITTDRGHRPTNTYAIESEDGQVTGLSK